MSEQFSVYWNKQTNKTNEELKKHLSKCLSSPNLKLRQTPSFLVWIFLCFTLIIFSLSQTIAEPMGGELKLCVTVLRTVPSVMVHPWAQAWQGKEGPQSPP